MNLRTYWETRVQKNPEKIFLYYADEKVSYGEFDARINQVANGFVEMGLKKEDKVSLLLPNIPEFLYSWFGLVKMGTVVVPLNTALTPTEAQYVVNHSESIGLIAHKDTFEVALQIQKDCPHLKWISCVDGDDLPTGIIPYDQFYNDKPRDLKDFHLKDEDLSCIIYTSGTTGFPKGAMHDHKTPSFAGENFLMRAALRSTDRVMAILPLFHVNAQFGSLWGTIAAEASLILIRRFSASRFWDQAVQYGATEFNFIGAIGKILCNRPGEEFRPEHTIRTACGTPVTQDVYETFTKRFHISHVIDAYGLTEFPLVSQIPIDGVIKMKSIGLPGKLPDSSITYAEMKIVDDEGKEVPHGEVGELIIRGVTMMKGYYKEPEKTKEAIRDGWFYTGDYVYQDEDGYFFFVERKKDIIRRKGENVSPAEVEAVINENSKVSEAAVIPVPSELGEDDIMACVVLKPDQSMKPEEVIDWCKDRLASFKIPRFVQFRKDIPKTVTEKIQKAVIKKEEDLIKRSYDMESYKRSLGI